MENTRELAPAWWDQGICLITGYMMNNRVKQLREQAKRNENNGKTNNERKP